MLLVIDRMTDLQTDDERSRARWTREAARFDCSDGRKRGQGRVFYRPDSQNAAFRAFILLNRATYRVFPGFQRKNAIHSSIFIDLTSQQLEKLYKSFRKP